MLEKIVSIKNVGCFHNYSSKGDTTLRKLTLLFADNGRGKTTLCAVLRSLQSGIPEYITERKTLSETNPSSVQLLIEGNAVSFTDNSWSIEYPDTAIFDSVFIHENVYAGDYVEHDHKKNLYRIIIGKQGVQLSKQIDELDSQVRGVNTEIRAMEGLVSKTIPQGVTIDDYLKWKSITDIDVKIKRKSKEVSNQQFALEKADQIKARSLFTKIKLPAIPSDFTAILNKQLADISKDAETQVRRQLVFHQMEQRGESWLAEGLGYINNEHCPFCGQSVHSNGLIEAYQSYFSLEYKELKEEVTQLTTRINDAIGESSLLSVRLSIAGNLTLVEFWKQFIDVQLPDFPLEQIFEKYSKIREQCIALVQKKQENPIEPVPLNSDFSSALSEVEALSATVDTYNAIIDDHNTKINEKKNNIEKGGDILLSLKKELSFLEAVKQRFQPEVEEACQAYQASIERKAQLEQKKGETRELLDEYCRDVLCASEQSINEYLDQFNTGFRIANIRHLYTGGTPSCQFQILINNAPVDIGDPRTIPGTPCFKTTLSSGDRSALALAFFLTTLKHDPEINKKIVVFDDPFTSLDRFRRTCTAQLIRRFVNTAQQVIVLSHDPYFLKLIYDEYSGRDIKELQLCLTGNDTVITEWNIIEETKSTYLKNHSILLNFFNDRTGNPLEVVKAIRPFIEGLLRSHFPGCFLPNEWLGNMIEKIRNASNTDGLYHEHNNLSELESINEYSKKYHHEQNANADLEPINRDELHGYVKRTLRLAGGC
jgi:wobble nucleotide-excising tRNase